MSKKNFLDFVPAHSPKIKWNEKDGIVTVDMYHRGVFPWIVQKFFKRPGVSHIKLDDIGSFIWKCIDGKNTVNDIADKLKSEFGAKAEPLYDRLVKYMQILKNNSFIVYVKEK